MQNTSSCSGRETDRIREWESQVGVDLMSKEAQLKQGKTEQASLEAEMRQLMILNGELTQSIKAENDSIKKFEAEDKLVSEYISDSEAELKTLQMCMEEHEDCLRVCGLAHKVQNEDKTLIKSTIEGKTTSYTDQVQSAEQELEELKKVVQARIETKNVLSAAFEMNYTELKIKIGRADTECESILLRNKKDSSYVIQLQCEHTSIKDSLGKTKMQLCSIQEETENLTKTEADLRKSNEELCKQLQCLKQENFSIEEKESKLCCKTTSLVTEANNNALRKSSIIESIKVGQGVIEELQDLKAQMIAVLLSVDSYQLEAERLQSIEETKYQAELEKSNVLGVLNALCQEIDDTNEKINDMENFENDKVNIQQLVLNKEEELQVEDNKRNQFIGDMHLKQQVLQNLERECADAEKRLCHDNAIIKEKEVLLEENINPQLLKLHEQKDMVDFQERQLASKEVEKRDMLMLVSRRTNEVHLESKARLESLKALLDEKLVQATKGTSEVGMLENEIANKEQYYEKEIDRIAQEEESKVELAVKPVLQDYETTQLKKLESQWQKFKSPPSSRRIQFAPKGKNLVTASPFDVVLGSQEKTNRTPKSIFQMQQEKNESQPMETVEKRTGIQSTLVKRKTMQSSQEV